MAKGGRDASLQCRKEFCKAIVESGLFDRNSLADALTRAAAEGKSGLVRGWLDAGISVHENGTFYQPDPALNSATRNGHVNALKEILTAYTNSYRDVIACDYAKHLASEPNECLHGVNQQVVRLLARHLRKVNPAP